MRQLSKLGLALRCQGNPSSLIDAAKSAEESGFDSIWLVEVTEVDVMALAGLLSQATRKIKIATGVVNSTLRVPTLLAMGATTISELSNGRFTLGVGAGRHQMSYTQSNSEDTDLTRLRETIQILRLCFSGENVDFQGKLYKVSGFKLGIKPSHQIPIFGAAMGRKMVETVSEVADGVLLMMPTMDYFKKVKEIIFSVSRKRGLSKFPIGCHFVTSVSEDTDYAERIAKTSVAIYTTRPAYRKSIIRMGFSKEVDALSKAVSTKPNDAWREVPTDMAKRLIIYGTPDECIRKINEFVDEGVMYPVVYPCMTESGFPNNAKETIRLLSPFATKV